MSLKGLLPKISVVIPAYNEEKFLPKLLDSLNQQLFDLPYEIIVVDNNSTDKTAAIAKKYGAHVVTEKKRGYAHTCNAGFYSAKGEIIARADADYVLPKQWLTTIWKSFQNDKKLTAVGGPTYPLESYWWENILYYPITLVVMYILKLLGRGFLYPNIAMRKNAFLKTKGFNTAIAFGEDVDMCLRLKKIGKVIINPHMYIYMSMRRMKAMGLFNFVTKYFLENQIAMWLGKEAKTGLEIIRTSPNKPTARYSPWVYLIVAPMSIITIITSYLALSYRPVQIYVLELAIKPILSIIR